MNKKLLLIPFTIIASVALLGPMASAGTVTMDYGSRHSGNGGEFNAYSADPGFVPSAMGYDPQATYTINSHTGFETFCMELNEHFSPGSSYYYAISDRAIQGGIGPSGDPISIGTALLYGLFATHNLPGYDYTGPNSNSTSAAELQATIWWLEGEVPTDPNNQFSMLITNLFGSAAAAMADNNGFYGVGVLNLWVDNAHTELAQDQLILTPGPGQHEFEVPDGGSTAMLLGLGFIGLFVGRWKLNRRSHAA